MQETAINGTKIVPDIIFTQILLIFILAPCSGRCPYRPQIRRFVHTVLNARVYARKKNKKPIVFALGSIRVDSYLLFVSIREWAQSDSSDSESDRDIPFSLNVSRVNGELLEPWDRQRATIN